VKMPAFDHADDCGAQSARLIIIPSASPGVGSRFGMLESVERWRET